MDNSALIERLQEDIQQLQLELDEEREESSRKDTESAALAEMLSEKEGVLAEAGQVMQDAQTLYDNAKTRWERGAMSEDTHRHMSFFFFTFVTLPLLCILQSGCVGARESQAARRAGEHEGREERRHGQAQVRFLHCALILRCHFFCTWQLIEWMSLCLLPPPRYQMEEMQVNVETAHLENQKLRAEIAEMTGDDMRAAAPPARRDVVSGGGGSGSKESEPAANSPPPAPSPAAAGSQKLRASTEAANTSSRSAAAAAKALNLTARRAEIEEGIRALKELVHITLGSVSSPLPMCTITHCK